MLGDQKCILRSVIDIFFRHLLIIIVTQFPYQEVRENTHIILHKKVYIYTHLYMYVCMYTYMHTYIHIYIYIYIHAYTYPYAYTCMCIYTCIYIHIHTYVYMYIHVCVCMCIYIYIYIHISSVQLLSHFWLFATSLTAARQASLYITNSQSLPKLMSIESVMPSDHLILFRPLLLPPSILPARGSFPMRQFFTSGSRSIGVSASASVLPMNI